MPDCIAFHDERYRVMIGLTLANSWKYYPETLVLLLIT